MICGFLFGTLLALGAAKFVHMHRYGECGAGGCGPFSRGRRGPFGRRHWGHQGWGDEGHGGGDREDYGRSGHHHDHDHGERGFKKRWLLRFLSERLDATPAQEKVIRQAIDEVGEEIYKARSDFRSSRDELASILGADIFDNHALEQLFERHDGAIAGVRRSVAGATGRIHEALDERQRRILADLIAHGFGPFGRGR